MSGNLIRHGSGGSAGTCGICEDVQVSEGKLFNHTTRFFKLGGGFAGESHHDVGSYGGRGHGGANLFNLLAIMPGTIFSVHTAKYGVAARLQRDVSVLRDTRRAGNQGDKVVGPVHRLDGGNAKLLQTRFFEDGADEVLETQLRCLARS